MYDRFCVVRRRGRSVMYAGRYRETSVRYCQSVLNRSYTPTYSSLNVTDRHRPDMLDTPYIGATTDRTPRTGHSEIDNQGYRTPWLACFWPHSGQVLVRYGSESGLMGAHLWQVGQPRVAANYPWLAVWVLYTWG